MTKALVNLLVYERRILAHPFFAHGSVFLANDVDNGLPLYTTSIPLDDKLSHIPHKYRIGPMVDRDWWRGSYADISANRGPCEPPSLPFSSNFP